jgi:hypothetical protein
MRTTDGEETEKEILQRIGCDRPNWLEQLQYHKQ